MANLATTKARAAQADAAQNTGGLLTKKVDAAARVMMQKQVNPNQSWQVVLLVDRSGSMYNEYDSGAVQDAVNRALGFAVIVDDDGSVPTIFFDSRVEEHTIKLDNFHNYVSRQGIDARGSTGLTQALERAAQITGNGDLFSGGGFFGRNGGPKVKKADTPVFIIVVTDGRPDDERSAADAIRRLSYRGVFVKFIYVGSDRHGWQFLERLDDDIPVGVPFERGGRLVDNVDAKKLRGLTGLTDDAFYEAMLDEIPGWTTAARNAGLI